MAQGVVDLVNNGETKLKFVEWPADAKKRETGDFVADISKVKRELGWEPRYTLEDGLRETIQFYQKNLLNYYKMG